MKSATALIVRGMIKQMLAQVVDPTTYETVDPWPTIFFLFALTCIVYLLVEGIRKVIEFFGRPKSSPTLYPVMNNLQYESGSH